MPADQCPAESHVTKAGGSGAQGISELSLLLQIMAFDAGYLFKLPGTLGLVEVRTLMVITQLS